MRKTFFKGIIFGCGFCVSIMIFHIAMQKYYEQKFLNERISSQNKTLETMRKNQEELKKVQEPKKNESIEPQDLVRKSSVIAILEYKRNFGEKTKVIITEILRINEGVEFNYIVGDEYPFDTQSYNGEELSGDGVVAFFSGSPALLQSAMVHENNTLLLGNTSFSKLKSIINNENDS